MKSFLLKFISRGGDIALAQPVLALFIGAALFAFFLSMLFPRAGAQPSASSWAARFYGLSFRVIHGISGVLCVLFVLSLVRNYLHQNLTGYQRTHGRITEANYHAVETIWGASQEQGDLSAELFYEEEITERIESEDPIKPALLRKKTVRHTIPTNPFMSGKHEVSLRQNTRRKGSALYGGYETDCHFSWQLKNPVARPLHAKLQFPLPAAGAVYDDLTATLNGKDVLPAVQLKDSALVLSRELGPDEAFDFTIGFRSRGMSFWYFQVREPREIRNFLLTLTLPEISPGRLNYPEGCMSPTLVAVSSNRLGSTLTYRLDHAISSKGMGIELPALPQPGAPTAAVLAESETGWLLVFAMLLLGLTLSGIAHAAILSIFFSTVSAFGYGFLAQLSDLLPGFWTSLLLVLSPLFLFLGWMLIRVTKDSFAKPWTAQLLVFGLLYPCLAGLDSSRQSLYFNAAALLFTALAAWQLAAQQRPPPSPTD